VQALQKAELLRMAPGCRARNLSRYLSASALSQPILLPDSELLLSEPSQLLISIGYVDQSILVTNIENASRGATRLLGAPSPKRGVLGHRCRRIGQARTTRRQKWMCVSSRTHCRWLATIPGKVQLPLG